MLRRIGFIGWIVSLLGCALWLALPGPAPAVGLQDAGTDLQVSGRLVDWLQQAVPAGRVMVFVDGGSEPVAETESAENGAWLVRFGQQPSETIRVTVERPHFATYSQDFTTDQLLTLIADGAVSLGDLTLESRATPGSWVAGLTFAGVLVLIALEKLRNALAALAGIAVIFVVTYLGGALSADWYVIDFSRAITYINWEVVFLVMGMMIVVGIIEGTGVFQWLAFMAYRVSRGRISLLIFGLIVITSLASAVLDNVTTMLLMAPISIQIALALGLNPLVLLVPEILATNVFGLSTLIGTPTNILIGADAGIGFNDFLINQTPGVLIAGIVMTAYMMFYYRAAIGAYAVGISPALYGRLKKNAAIRDRKVLLRASIVFACMLVFFILGERLELEPAVTALVGATALLLWVEPDVEKMLRVVDWTALVFFMALFMLVGAVQETGVLSVVAAAIGALVGQSLALGIVVLVLGVGVLSFAIANVPLAAAMLPVVRILSAGIPGAESNALYYALSMGAAMGGNGLLIGGEAHLMTAGIAERAGYPIKFMAFVRVSLPVTLLTLSTGALWLLLRFVIFGG